MGLSDLHLMPHSYEEAGWFLILGLFGKIYIYMHSVGSGQRIACGLYFIVNKVILSLLGL